MKKLLSIFFISIFSFIQLINVYANTITGTDINNQILQFVTGTSNLITANGWTSTHYDVSNYQGQTLYFSARANFILFSSTSSTTSSNSIIAYGDQAWNSSYVLLPSNNAVVVPNNAQRLWVSNDTVNSNTFILSTTPIPVAPTFGTDTITWNYDPITDELTATYTSTQPTYSANDITARGIITGTSADYNSPSDLSNVAGTQHPKTNGYTGTQTVTIVNPPRGEQLFMRTYVQYNNQDMYYSPGVAVSPPNYAVRQLDFIDWNGFVLATYYPELYSTAQAFDTQTQSLIPAREGYVFNGFTGDTDITTELKVFQRTAQYTQLQSYTVTFVDWDNTVLGTDTVYEGQPASPPVIPTRTGYTFDSWLPPIADIQGNITTVAQYTPNTYLVTWNNLGVEILAEQLDHDDNILSYAPFVTREDYNLVGWKLDPTEILVTSGQVVTSPLSLTAVWEAVPTYTVTWRDPSFNTLKIEYVQESGLATAPTYDPGSGLVLTGWTPDPTQGITENTIFVATVTNAPAPPTVPGDYSPISDLFGGVIGASIGAVMTLGTIDLYGIQLSAIIYLFVSMSLGLWILKAIRG